jgi:antitoxin YefM
MSSAMLTEMAKYVLISVQKEAHMSQAITYTEARQNLAETMNRVCDHHEPVIITRQKSPSVVMMSLEDYNAIMETAYLLRSPANAARLREALHAADAGKTVQHDLED